MANNIYSSMKGKTVVVSGAGSGIGLAATMALARSGAVVVGIVRNAQRAETARKAIRNAGIESLEFEICDLSSLREVAALAERLCSKHPRIHGLLNNAGIFTSHRVLSIDGIEIQLATNHLAGFLLTQRLLPALEASGDGRIVCISSGSHFPGRMHWKNLALKPFYSGLAAYERSKYANVLFIRAFAARHGPDSAISAYAVDPGLVDTDMGSKHANPLVGRFWNSRRKKGVTAAEGADTAVWLLCAPKPEDGGGHYWKERTRIASSRRSMVPSEAERLWTLSIELCGRAGV